jgi:MYXO-CTERM domain-containing protein
MRRIPLFIGAAVLTVSSFAQQTNTGRNLNPDAYTRDTYNRPVDVRTGSGNWGLLGLLGLAGLFGLRRGERIIRDREEYLNEQRRRVA